MSSARRFHVPTDRHYEREHHVWAQPVAGTGRVRIGIDAIGLESLGELAYVALQPVGTVVDRGAALGSLEAAKMTTSIVAPCAGTITARNEAALADPALVNRAPYEDGWLVELAADDFAAAAAVLVSGDAIPAWAAAATARLEAESENG